MKERDSGQCQWSGPGQGGHRSQQPGQTPGRVKAKGKNLGQSLRAERRAREGGEKAIIFTTFNLISFYTKIPRGSEEEEH